MAESYSVKAILSAKDAGFTAGMRAAENATQSLSSKIKSGIGFGVFSAVGTKAVDAVTSGVTGLVSEMNSSSATWKTFESNMGMLGKGEKEIAKTKNALQDFAIKTIYDASEMASTYSQLAAVGTKDCTKLVKGFAGLAAAGEKPKQAMKTLSQQATQMAAKPTVQWQDFKLMLEQTPAGIAAVAREMGKSASQLTLDVQNGTVSTEEFFKAVTKAGTNKSFTKLATTYKTAEEAMDGLHEALREKLEPAHNEVSRIAITGIEGIIEKVSKIDIDGLTKKIKSIADAFDKNGIGGALSATMKQINQSGDVLKQFGALAVAAFSVAHINDFASAFGKVTEAVGSFKLPNLKDKLDFSKLTKSTLKHTRSIKKSFASLGKGIDDYGFKIANSMETISPKLSDAGTKIWDSFAGAGEKVSNFGNKISKGLTSKIKGATGVLSAFGGKVSAILAPLQTVGSAVLGVGSKIASGLTSMMSLALKALMPAALVGVVLAGFGVLYQQFGSQIDQMLSMAQSKGPEIISNLATGIASALPELVVSGAQLVTGLINTITTNLSAIVNAGTLIIANLVNGVSSAAPSLISSGAMMIGQLVVSLASALPQLITTGMQLLLSLAQGIVSALPNLINSATQAVTSFIGGISQNLPQILSTAVQIVVTLATGLISAIPQIVAAVPQIASALVNALMETDWLAVGKSIVSAIGKGLTSVKDWFTGGKKGGEETSAGVASGISSGTSKATSAAGNVTSGVTGKLKSGSGEAKSAGNAVISGYASAVSSGSTKATSAVSSSTSKITKSMKKTTSPAKSAGKQTGNGYTSSLKSGLNKAPAVASSVVSKVNTTLRSGRSGAHSAGQMISAGFASGMQSCLGQIRSAAAQMVAAADAAIRAKAKIHSPSRVTRSHGYNMAVGLGLGMAKGISYIRKTGKSMVDAALSTLTKATKTREYETAADTAIDKIQKKIESQVSKQTKSVTNTLSTYIKKLKKQSPRLKKAYSQVEKVLKSNITSSLKKEGQKLINAADKALTALGKKYQEKYDEIIDDRKNYYSQLSDYGDLYSVDSYGFVNLKDFSAQEKQVKSLASNMKKLKGVLPYDLMTDIQNMDTATALSYTNELLKKDTSWLKKYGKSYTSLMSTANKQSKAYYKSYITNLDSEYNKAVKAELKKLKTKMNDIGKQAVSGFVSGLKSKSSQKALKKVSSSMANTIIKTIKSKLKIHSPSRVLMSLGQYTVGGFVKGIEGMGTAVEDAMNRVITIPDIQTPALAGNYNFGELSSDYDYYRNVEYTVVVPVEIDGKETAKVLAKYTQDELDRMESRENRKRGRR